MQWKQRDMSSILTSGILRNRKVGKSMTNDGGIAYKVHKKSKNKAWEVPRCYEGILKKNKKTVRAAMNH